MQKRERSASRRCKRSHRRSKQGGSKTVKHFQLDCDPSPSRPTLTKSTSDNNSSSHARGVEGEYSTRSIIFEGCKSDTSLTPNLVSLSPTSRSVADKKEASSAMDGRSDSGQSSPRGSSAKNLVKPTLNRKGRESGRQPRSLPLKGIASSIPANATLAISGSPSGESRAGESTTTGEDDSVRSIGEAKAFLETHQPMTLKIFEIHPPTHHSELVTKIVFRALKGNEADAQLAARLFEKINFSKLCSSATLERGFSNVMPELGTLVTDHPTAIKSMAIMVSTSKLSSKAIKILADKICKDGNLNHSLLRLAFLAEYTFCSIAQNQAFGLDAEELESWRAALSVSDGRNGTL